MNANPFVVPAQQTFGDPMYELSGVSFAAGDRVLLHPLTMTLPASRVCGLIGHNGSGKSTLLKLLARQQAASSGSLSFEGRPLDEWDNRAFARRVAYLPQQQPGANGMTVRELVALGRYPWHGALGRFTDDDRAKVEEAMALTDMARFPDLPVDNLSGGERQRAWIAMLVAQDSQCLLLDEPISALDIAHQIEVLALVRDLSRQRGLGVVVVLHDVNMAARFCDDLIALKGGRLLASGPAQDLIEEATLAEIYGVPMGIVAHPRGGAPISFAY
ncbi:ATP-binding cassette domain-containing protein [Trinickia caryophylli]|uniref:Iron complex transport system ATP-binding protein n=1 Tax=Trinickia caryophylli TaxID=28094 RepID=A0A1X7GAN0_TRICW|nr:ATP-binding cassette domain-containing protein [Trinickia caryophylli]PMS11336.1 iron-hydroxamate transporter ATP-binding subunit [Trinickia caryophylli]WQE11726.1 ATP-binding cassette domain-containing protein [Trinickia caryophylli]GLU34914.1 iron-hydroxamate transporter ATP-binding protein [Trinickia caryophylli]SMF66868.1 iron complex transport system ATP-binding protein [Trinickia caryophylli]